MNRREMLTIVGSISSSLSLPISLASVVRADDDHNKDTEQNRILRTTYVPGPNSGKIQEIKNGEEIQNIEIEDKQTWLLHARSLANSVGVSLPLFAQFTPYKVSVDDQYWTIAYTNENGYIIDIYHSKHSPDVVKTALFEIPTKHTIRIESQDMDSLISNTRELLKEEAYHD